MANKRKRDDSLELTQSKAPKIAEEVSRSGRTRKKPARFLDQEDESNDDEAEETSTTEPVVQADIPQQVLVVPKSEPVFMPILTTAMFNPGIQTANVSSSYTAEDTPSKSSRVRKKSAKVIEMEEFEKAEKVKVTKRAVKSTSPDTGMMPVVKAAGTDTGTVPVATFTGIQPHILQAANLQLNLMSSLNPSAMPDAKPTLPIPQHSSSQVVKTSVKKKSADDVKVKQVPLKIEKKMTGIPLMTAGPFVSPGETVMADQHLNVKDEPIDTVDPNVLLPHSAPGSVLLSHLTNIAQQQQGEVTPLKSTKKKTKVKGMIKEEPISSPDGSPTKGSSVIKMLLNKPAQFSEPVISTQTLSNINSTSAEKNAKKIVRMKKESESSPVNEMGDNYTAPVQTKFADHNTPVTSAVQEKKKVKKLKKKHSPPVIDDDEEDDDDYEEEDDDILDDELDEDDMDWEFETQDGNLIIADEGPSKKTSVTTLKKPPSKKKGKKEDSSNLPSGKDKKTIPPKEKKKKRLTAYTMWCNSVRYKVLNENPGIDFAQLSKRLGEIWQSVPAKDKIAWKRKAKREARRLLGKGLLITTGKGGQSNPQPVASSAPTSSSNTPPPIYHAPIKQTARHQSKSQWSYNATSSSFVKQEEPLGSPTKVLGIEPIDTAAHLKLVGDSLSIIGIRLQEHRGLIAVQGSLSVLLDSLLCAIGPLMCLTTQVKELNGCSAKTHTQILDNIAYIMPGL